MKIYLESFLKILLGPAGDNKQMSTLIRHSYFIKELYASTYDIKLCTTSILM